jgi:hypothetical protein
VFFPPKSLSLSSVIPNDPCRNLQKSRDREKKKRILEESPDIVGYLRHRIEPQSLGPIGSCSAVIESGIASSPFPDPLRKSRMQVYGRQEKGDMGVSGSRRVCECRLKTDGKLLSEMDLKMVESRDLYR